MSSLTTWAMLPFDFRNAFAANDYRWNNVLRRWEVHAPLSSVSFGMPSSSWVACDVYARGILSLSRTVRLHQMSRTVRVLNARHGRVVPSYEVLDFTPSVFSDSDMLCSEPCCGWCLLHNCAPCICGCH
jgi:hypothetical protein